MQVFNHTSTKPHIPVAVIRERRSAVADASRDLVSAHYQEVLDVKPAGMLTRRQMLRLALLCGFGNLVVACATTDTQPTAQDQPRTLVTQAAPAATTRPVATSPAAVPTVASTAAASAAEPTTAPQATAAPVPTAEPVTLAADIASAATRFLGALDEGARSTAVYVFGDSERQRWHWTTPSGFPRNGLPLRDMSQEQRTMALELLRVSVSPAGYQKALDIMSLQNDLGSDPELYYVTVFGDPGGAEPWGWRFEGHHLSRQFTVSGDRVAMTPFFLGSWPTTTNAGLRAMGREEDAARELVTSLEDAKRAVAIFQGRTLTRHLTQNEPYVGPLDPVGISVGDLNDGQRALANEIIETYLGVLAQSVATPMYDRLRAAGIENIRFGWAGSVEPRRPHYYRLEGPTFLLEFDNSRNGGTHIHSVWRDFTEDFGQHMV
jgi:hypothetical protein